MEFPIDIVYTWVDSNDINWLKRKNEFLSGMHTGSAVDGTDRSRFRDNDELKYSLRSVEKYTPWIRKIFIVTDKQNPEWLNKKNNKIQIVDHEEIFPDSSYLPTYNSMSVEACIHRIKDLSEHFIYFNDDMILGNYCSPSTFFAPDGKPYIYINFRDMPLIKKLLQKRGIRLFEHNTHHAALTNSRLLIYKTSGKFIKKRLSHGIMPFLKSTCIYLEDNCKEEIIKTMKSRFRDNENILMSALFSFYAIAEGTGIKRILYTPDPVVKIITKSLPEKWHVYLPTTTKKITKGLERINKYRPFQYCINDMPGTNDDKLILINKFYKNILPDKADFEI